MHTFQSNSGFKVGVPSSKFRAPRWNALRTRDSELETQNSERHKGWYLLFALAIILGFVSSAEAQTIRAYVSADSVKVGDRFSLTIVAEHTQTNDPLFPGVESGEDVFGDLEVLSVLRSGTSMVPGALTGTRADSLVYEVTTFALDTAYVPSIPVFFVAGADTSFFASYPIELPIISLVPADAEGIKDLAPLAEFPFNPWPWLLGLLLLAGLGALAYRYLRKREGPAPTTIFRAPEPVVSPFEAAVRRLRKLEKEADLEAEQRIKPYYVELTEILRTYLGRRLRINAMESTSAELLRDVNRLAHKKTIPPDAAYLTKRVMHVSDLVKFADMHPPPEVGHQALTEVRKLLDVVETALQPPEVPAAPVSPVEPPEKVEQVSQHAE